MTDLTLIFKHLHKADPKIFSIAKAVDYSKWLEGTREFLEPEYVFFRLCRSIIGQQLSGKAAETIGSRVLKLLPNGRYTPKAILALDKEAMRSAGLSYAKAKYVKHIAQAFIDGSISVEKLHDWTDEEVIDHLVAIKGVGPWTAEMFLMFTMGREDVFSHGDLGLRRGLEKVYGLQNPDRKTIEKIIAPWSPYKTYGSIALWHALE